MDEYKKFPCFNWEGLDANPRDPQSILRNNQIWCDALANLVDKSAASIRSRAEQIADKIDWVFRDPISKHVAIDAITSALLAERERCALIAACHSLAGIVSDTQTSNLAARVQHAIAAAIRDDDNSAR